MATVITEQTFKEMVLRLREFEGNRCLWRAGLAVSVYVAVRGLPIVGAVVVALTAVKGALLKGIASAAILMLFDGLGQLLHRRLPWKRSVSRRLWTYEAPNPASEVPVLLSAGSERQARRSLRRNKLNPQLTGRRVGLPPHDAPDLEYEIRVHEPLAWMRTPDDEARVERVVQTLGRAGIRARVAGVDTLPA